MNFIKNFFKFQPELNIPLVLIGVVIDGLCFDLQPIVTIGVLVGWFVSYLISVNKSA